MDVSASARNTAREAVGRVRALPLPLTVFVWSRLLIWVTVLYAWIWFVPRPPRPPNPGDLGYATEVWARADSGWFLPIAQHGYQRNGGAVFYPLYPLLVGLLGRAFGGYYVTAGIVVSLASCLGAFFSSHFWLLRGSASRAPGERSSTSRSFPMSLFLQAVYSESLYLLCVLAAFFFADRRPWLGAGVMTGLALHPTRGRRASPTDAASRLRSPERRRALLSMLAAPALASLIRSGRS